MRKALFGVFAAVLIALGFSQVATATNRPTIYQGQNPDALQTNQAYRYQRLADGTVLRDILGAAGAPSSLASSGAWSSLQIVGVNLSGAYVYVAPTPATQTGVVYSLLPDDPSPVPAACPTGFPSCSGYQLNADSTNIVVAAIVQTPSPNLGPMNCPTCTSGQWTSWLIESQIQTAPGNNRSMMFVSSSGSVSYPNVNSEVDDGLTFAVVQGSTASWATPNPTASPGVTPQPTPGMPTAAPGWMPLAYVEVGNTASPNCNAWPNNNCYITMAHQTQFQAGAFGVISFGGYNAQQGLLAPSTLSTTANSVCGIAATNGGAQGFVFNNPASPNNGTHVLGADAYGNLAVCGNNLIIFDQNSTSVNAEITVTTPVDTGVSTVEHLFPASGTIGVSLDLTCPSNTQCALLGGPQSICPYNGGSNAAMISASITGGGDNPFLFNQTWVSGSGLLVQLYNDTNASVTTSVNPITLHYICM